MGENFSLSKAPLFPAFLTPAPFLLFFLPRLLRYFLYSKEGSDAFLLRTIIQNRATPPTSRHVFRNSPHTPHPKTYATHPPPPQRLSARRKPVCLFRGALSPRSFPEGESFVVSLSSPLPFVIYQSQREGRKEKKTTSHTQIPGKKYL